MKIEIYSFIFHDTLRIAVHDLKLEKLFVVYPGKENYDLGDRIQVISIFDFEMIKLLPTTERTEP